MMYNSAHGISALLHRFKPLLCQPPHAGVQLSTPLTMKVSLKRRQSF